MHPVGVCLLGTCTYAEKDVVRVGIGLVYVVDVVGGNQLDVQVPGKGDQLRKHLDLLGDEMVLDLDVIPVTEQVLVPSGHLVGALDVASKQFLRNLTC